MMIDAMVFQLLPRTESLGGSIQISFGPVPQWTLDEYCLECGSLIDMERLHAIVGDSKTPLVYKGSRFELNTALGA